MKTKKNILSKKSGMIYETLKYLQKYLEMKEIVEIMINQEYEVIIEDIKGNFKYYEDKNLNQRTLESILQGIAKIKKQRFDVEYDILSTEIPVYNFRITGAMYGIVGNGISITIRLGNTKSFPLDHYFSKKMCDFLKSQVIQAKNILIFGGTGSGKTTCLNSLIPHIPLDLRILTLENNRELNIPHKNHCSFLVSESKGVEGYKKATTLLQRSRPDRILCGEFTLENTKYFLNLMNTGHSGTMSTLHADTPKLALEKIRQYLMLSGTQSSEWVFEYIGSTLDFFIQMEKTKTRQIKAKLFKIVVKNQKVFFDQVTDNF